MKTNIQTLVLTGFLSAVLTACGGDSKSDSSGTEKKPTEKPKTEKVTPKPQTNTKPTSQTNTSGKVAQEWVNAHNKHRKNHQVGNVKWSDTVAKSAENFVKNCPKKHSNTHYGENLARGSGVFGEKFAEVVDYWYSEEPKHNYNSNAYQPSSGHFSQIVWKGTTEIGCAYNPNCEKNGYKGLYVCQYNPAGNVRGQVKDNVFPRK